MADEQIAEAWVRSWADWIAANLPAGLAGAGFVVMEATEEGERPERLIVVGLRGNVDRVPAQNATGRVSGVIVLREPRDGDGQDLAGHRANVKQLWGLLKTVEGKPGEMVSGIFLHDVRWEDRETGVLEDDRVTAFPVSNMATALVTV